MVLIIAMTVPGEALNITNGMIFDVFNDGDADGWVFPYNSALSQGPGIWSVENGELVQWYSGDGNSGLVDNLLIGDQAIEVQARTNGYAGVVLWYQQVDDTWANYVAVDYNVQTGLAVRELIDGQADRYIYGGSWIGNDFDLRVEADSATGELKVSIYSNTISRNDTFTYSVDTTYRTGLSGVFSGNAVGYFDDFRLTSDDIAPISEPAKILLLSTGLIGLAGWGRKKFKKN